MKKLIKWFKNLKINEVKSKESNHIIYEGLLIKTPFWSVIPLGSEKSLDIYLPVYNEHRKFLDENRLKLIKFIIIDEFSHPELFKDVSFMNGKQYAKLIYDER